jgi:transcription antitermination factor NusG
LSNTKENTHWYVVYTRPRWEKKIAKLLDEKGIENYCPLNKVRRQWKDRKKIILEPLFKGYLFVKMEESKKWDIKMIDGIINYVYWLKKPAIVKEDEINTIRKFLNEFENVDVVELDLKASAKVVVTKGILMNYKGIVLEVIGNKARVQIDSMGIRLSAVIEKTSLEPDRI